jgi:hypothetical protein
MEIRFRTNDEIEEKIKKIQSTLHFSEKKELVLYLINREYDDIIKTEMKKV